MKKTYLTVIMVLMLLLSQTAESATVNIDLNTTHQTIRGFGGMNFPRWIGTLTDAQVDTAFGNGSGQIGFTIMRIDVPPSSYYWSGEVSAAVRAKSHGAIILATPWSPPASMKTNGSLIQGELKTDSYDDYADYLSDFADYMSSNGASLYAISVQNEPDWLPDYESCGWSASQMQTFLNNNASVIPTKVLAPETVHYKSDYVSAVASSSECDIIGVHLYGGSITYYSGKEYWQTEHYTSSDVNGNLWPDALGVAKEIHDCMTANMSAYIWWYIRRFYGPIDEHRNITKRGYVMSQYAKFVRPGYTRVSATDNPQSGVYVTAYKSGDTLVIVAINQNSSSMEVTFSLSGCSVSSYTKYVTSSSNNVSNQGSVGSTNTLAANSINTFVGTIGGGIPGDLNEDLKVDFIDFAILGQGWQTTYDIYTLADIADNWLYGGSYPENSMGFIGCSMAENVATGYRAVGGRRMWGPYGTGGLVVQNWTDTNSSAWQKFDQQVAQYGRPSAVWVQICIFAWWGATYDEVKQMIANARQHAADGATIYITGQPLYPEGNVCFLAGADGPQLTDDLAQQAGNDPSQNVIYSGIFTLRNSEVAADGCHANSAGEIALGNQAVEKWGE